MKASWGTVDPCPMAFIPFLCRLFASPYKLTFPGDCHDPVAFGGDIFAHRFDIGSGDDGVADTGLDRHFKELARNQLLELLYKGQARVRALSRGTMMESASTTSPATRMSSLTRSSGPKANGFVIKTA